MIVRERTDSFIMIEQDHHGRLAETIMSHWKDSLFPDPDNKGSVLTAIREHDRGWVPYDKQPFWNDAKQKPYRFTDYPLLPKLALYTQGIDEVENIDTYAAMLCSEHYSRFIQSSGEDIAQEFLNQEEQRRTRLAGELADFDETLFRKHYGLLQLGDNFSLYACVNEPGATKEEEHPFFVNGIPSPESLNGLPHHRLDIRFIADQMITVEDFPFDAPFEVRYPYRRVWKSKIEEKGLLKAYESTEAEDTRLLFTNE